MSESSMSTMHQRRGSYASRHNERPRRRSSVADQNHTEMQLETFASFLLGAATAFLPPIIGLLSVSCSADACRLNPQPELIVIWVLFLLASCFLGWAPFCTGNAAPVPEPIFNSAARAFYLTIALVPVMIVGLIGVLLLWEGRDKATYGAAMVGIFVSGMAIILRAAIQAILAVCEFYETQAPSSKPAEAGSSEDKKLNRIDLVKISVAEAALSCCSPRDRRRNSPAAYKSNHDLI